MVGTQFARKYLKLNCFNQAMFYLTEKGKQYLEEWHRLRKDFSHNIPGKLIEEFPVSGNEGLYGWTFVPDDGRIRRREDLRGTYKGSETDIHECAHDPFNDVDFREYRTRLITREHMKNVVGEETKKYETSPPDYNR